MSARATRCALREVEEETGLRCELGPELATTHYVDAQGRLKRVRRLKLMTPVAGDLAFRHEVDDALALARGGCWSVPHVSS